MGVGVSVGSSVSVGVGEGVGVFIVSEDNWVGVGEGVGVEMIVGERGVSVGTVPEKICIGQNALFSARIAYVLSKVSPCTGPYVVLRLYGKDPSGCSVEII